MKSFLLHSLLTLFAITSLTGCGGKEKQAKIDELTRELELAHQSFESERKSFDAEREENDKLRDENNHLKMKTREAEGRAKTAEREVERLKEREQMARETKQRAPSSREKLEAAKTAAAELLNAVVTIKGDQSSGSGTLVQADDKSWIYLPASFLGANTKLEVTLADGTRLEKFGSFELAADADLARLEVKDEVTTKLSPESGAELKSGTILLGVDDSGSIMDSRAYGTEPATLRADSRFSKCLTGTPVFSGENTGLIGILLEPRRNQPTLWDSATRSTGVIRREICRLDRTISWTPISITAFLDEAKTLSDADRFTRLVFAFAATIPSTTGVSLDTNVGGSTSARSLFEKNQSMSAVKSLYALDEWLKEKGARASKADLSRRVDGVYGDILRRSTKNTATLSQRKFSPYHAAAATQSIEWRKDAEKKLKTTASAASAD